MGVLLWPMPGILRGSQGGGRFIMPEARNPNAAACSSPGHQPVNVEVSHSLSLTHTHIHTHRHTHTHSYSLSLSPTLSLPLSLSLLQRRAADLEKEGERRDSDREAVRA